MELSFLSIAVLIAFWIVWSKVSKSKTVMVVADSMQQTVQDSAGWAHQGLTNSIARSNIGNAIELQEEVKVASEAGVTIASHKKNLDEWGL